MAAALRKPPPNGEDFLDFDWGRKRTKQSNKESQRSDKQSEGLAGKGGMQRMLSNRTRPAGLFEIEEEKRKRNSRCEMDREIFNEGKEIGDRAKRLSVTARCPGS